MRFMMIVKADKNYEAGVPPSSELMAAIEQLTQELVSSGRLVDMGGLLPSAAGACVNVRGGKLAVTDGPFIEAKELIGGYAIIRAESRAEAIELGKKFMQAHADVLGPSYDGQLEIRQMADFEANGAPEVAACGARAS